MPLKTVYLLFLVLIFSLASGLSVKAADGPFMFSKESRVLVVAPHPDDETLGTGGTIQLALAAGADVKVVYLTHGDYNEIASIFYQKKPLLSKSDFIKSGQIRKKEAIRAMSVLGLDQKNLVFLGYPDLGTLSIWRKHWGSTKPFRSFITRINKVPYKEDFSYGQPYRGENIVGDFEKLLLLYQPTHAFVTVPFDLNTDHRAAYLYFQIALLNLQEKISPPKVFTYLIHEHRWPTPRRYAPEKPLVPPARIEDSADLKWLSLNLHPDHVELKRQALLKYDSQVAYSKNFMLSFARANELFLELPYVDLKVFADADSSKEKKEEKGANASEASYWIQENEFWADIRVTGPLDELGTFNMEIFSYKRDEDFLEMPKLNLVLLGNHVWVRDGYKRLRDSGIRYNLRKKSLKIRIPLKVLKSPDYLFVSTRTIKNDISLDFGSWKVLKVPER